MSHYDSLKHLAIIMDGNGRWALERKHKRLFGHVQGSKKARSIISECIDLEIPYLTLFALSSENTLRPESEIKSLFLLFEKALFKYSSWLIEKDIQLHTLGDMSFFPTSLQDRLQKLKEKTQNNKGLKLILALNYGGRQEILKAVQSFYLQVEQKKMKLEDLTEGSFSSMLPSSPFPEPDLVIRTGGETRLSNFYLWSAAYSEIYFTDTLWPDFTREDLLLALKKYLQTHRKFGVL